MQRLMLMPNLKYLALSLLNKKEKTVKKLYHLSHIDLDGYSCQLVMSYTPFEIRSFNANYGPEVKERLVEILEASRNDNAFTILITDLNLNLEEATWLDKEVKGLNAEGKDVTLQLLDHHGSGQECADLYTWYHLDTSKSATLLTYTFAKEHYNLTEPAWLEAYVNVVDAVDLWHQDKHEAFEYGKVCMKLISDSRELSRVMFATEDREYKLTLLKEAAAMIDLPQANIVLDEKIHAMKKTFFKKERNDTLDNLVTSHVVELFGTKKELCSINYKGYRGFLTYSVGNTSIIGNGFLTRFDDEYDFIVDVSSRGTMSLRANNRVSVSTIAKEWANGGGHPNASGGRIQGFKEQFRYDKVKEQIQKLIAIKENSTTLLTPKS